ncbi:glycosyltransferase [Candidatus Latescibacterota bacterium]
MDIQWMESIPFLKKIKDRINFRHRIGDILCVLPKLSLVPGPSGRKSGISVYICVKNEALWIEPTLRSLAPFVDQFSLVDNGSTDDTVAIIERIASELSLDYVLEILPDADFGTVRETGMQNTTCTWVMRWDGDMVARTSGNETLQRLRDYVLSLDPKIFYAVYFPHVRLEGDLFHQNPEQPIHYEEWIFTYSPKLYHRREGRFREVMYPLYYKRVYYWETSSFHIASIYDPVTLINRKYWEIWRKMNDFKRYPELTQYTQERIIEDYGTDSSEDAGVLYMRERFSNLIPFDRDTHGDYPELLKPFLDTVHQRLVYRNGFIVGRSDIMPLLDRLDAVKKQMSVDVIVPTMNREEFALATVLKVLDQEYPNFGIIVSDQSDTPSEKLRELSETDDRVVYNSTKTRGLPASRNEATGLSSAEIILFVDDDVIPEPGFIEGHVLAYINDAIGGTAGKIIDRRDYMMKPVPVEKVGKVTTWTGNVKRGFFIDSFIDVETAPGGNMSFRRKVLVASGGFDTRFGGNALLEETDASLGVRKLGYTIRYTPHAKLTHLAATTGGCRLHDVSFDVYWYAHNSMLLFLKYFPRKVFPVWFMIRILKFLRDSVRSFSLSPLVSGLKGLFDGFRDYQKQSV